MNSDGSRKMSANAALCPRPLHSSDTCDAPHESMAGSNDDPQGRHDRFSRLTTSSSLGATRRRVDLVVASIENIGIPPPSNEVEACPSSSSRGRGGIQPRVPRVATGATTPTSLSENDIQLDHGSSTPLSATPVAATPTAGTPEGSPQGNEDGCSFSGLPSSFTNPSHALAARTLPATNAVTGSNGDSPSFTARANPASSGSVSGNPSRDTLSRSISSRSRRSMSTSSMRPLVPAARGLGLPSLAPRTLSARASPEGTMGASSFLPPSTPLVLGGGETYHRRASSRNSSSLQQNEQNSLPGYSSRLPARQARLEGGRASVRRLAGGGRDSWRAPAAAYNAVERRTGRDTTALRAVSARLDAAATAIDAVEIGVRSASDSLDSLLQLLESRPGQAVTPRASIESIRSRLESRSSASAMVSEESSDSADSQRAAREVDPEVALSGARGRAVVPLGGLSRSTASGSTAWEVLEGSLDEPSSGDVTTSVSPAQTAGREGWADARRIVSVYAREGGGGSRAANMLRRELAVGSVLPGSQAGAGERAETDEHVAGARETSGGTRDLIAQEPKGEPSTMDGRSHTRTLSPSHLSSSSAGHDIGEDFARRRRSQGRQSGRHHCPDSPTNSDRDGGGADGSTHSTRMGSRTLGGSRDGSGTQAAATMGSEVSGLPSDSTLIPNNRTRSSQAIEERRASPRGVVVADPMVLAANEENSAADMDRSDVSLPVRELEAAMDGIDTERGRLIMEIARLRGQQNQSLVHLQRLQNEQFVVRQRQVSTLSDIVNSFGRTVAAAGALPHGENSSLGRISSDVVSTLRRMLRLLSATVPAAIAASPTGATVDNLRLPATASTPQGLQAPPPSSPPPPVAGAQDISAANDATGTYSVGDRVALRPTGVDLTQEVIDAALQALPRLAAAASAISGARRMQGYLAGLSGDAEEHSSGAGRCCSKETIAALPDAPSSTEEGVVGEVDGSRGCVICLSEGTTPGQSLCSLPCDHVFHRVCVGKWLRMQDSCPTCRRQVPDVEIGGTTCPPQAV